MPPPLLAHHFLAGCTLPEELQRTLLRSAEGLHRGASALPAGRPLEGRHLAIARGPHEDGSPDPVEQAARDLGARVSHISPEALDGLDTVPLARLLGNLYDAIDCDSLSAESARRLQSLAGIPVFDGLAAAGRPLASLATAMSTPASDGDKLARLLQAALIETVV